LTAPSSPTGVTPSSATAPSPTASMMPNGPYDPNSYRPSATTTAAASYTSATPEGHQATGDRYGITPIGADPVAAEEPPRRAENLPTAPPTTSSPAGERYGLTNPATVTPSANMAGGQPQYDPTVMASPIPMAPPTASTAPATVASLTVPTTNPSLATATVQASAAGQYRPGGTSSYIGSIPVRAVEVATLPPASTSATPSTAPAAGIVPWTPAGTTTTPTGGTATQRF
jgi:hypothetical protein